MFCLVPAFDFVLARIVSRGGAFVFSFLIYFLIICIHYVSSSTYFVYFPNNYELNLDSISSIEEVYSLIWSKAPVQTREPP